MISLTNNKEPSLARVEGSHKIIEGWTLHLSVGVKQKTDGIVKLG